MNKHRLGFFLKPAIITANTPANAKGSPFSRPGFNCALLVLETVTVNATDVVVELKVAGLGLTAQFDPLGAPVQVKLTCPLNPPEATKVTW